MPKEKERTYGIVSAVKIEIDQSGKIEQTNLDTIVALTNEFQITARLSGRTKRALQDYFISIGKIERFATTIFAVVLTYLLKEYPLKTGRIIIDREYEGHNAFILQQLNSYLGKLQIENQWHFMFGHVGKTSDAHALAAKAGQNKKLITKTISLQECLKLTMK